MRYSGLIVLVLVAILNVAGWAYINRPIEPRPWGEFIHGVDYSPFRGDQGPNSGKFPSEAEIEQDMQVLSGQVRQIRTYSTLDGQGEIAKIAGRYGLEVMQGTWLDARVDRNEEEIRELVRIATTHDNVRRVLVGNETLLRADIPIEDLIQYIRRVRTELTGRHVEVSTAETWDIWLRYPQLGREVDFIAIHLLPYWEGQAPDKAVEYALARYQQVKDAYPTKKVVITEIGWPSEGRIRRDAVPSPTTQAAFLRAFLNIANQRGLDYFIQEAFDQPWKRNIEGSVGAYWGVWNADRTPKFPMVGPVSDRPHWPQLSAASILLALPLMVWFLARWADLRFSGRVFFVALIQLVTSAIVMVIDSGLRTYMSPGIALMWAMLLPLLFMLFLVVLAEGLELSEVIWASRRKRHFLPFKTDIERSWPKVSIHVPAYNEPPEMLKKTLDSLARLDYPNFEVLVIDNNTKDEKVWRPVEEYCRELGERFRFFHVSPLKGFKAGALNFALQHTAPDAEIIGVIDADYLIEPDWLKSLVPYFDRADIGFVQAPQDHYDWKNDTFKEFINWEYAGFFQIGMVQRNERDAIIQHGTMTLVRRAAIEHVGKWAEWCICEDAEMGLRLLAGGWHSVYTDKRYGYGLTPDSFSGYKSQRFRWAYGAVQIIKRHWRDMLPGADRKLDPMQRYHFVTGWMPWFADALGLVFAIASLAWTVGVMVLPKYFELPLALFLLPVVAVFGAKLAQFLWLYKIRVPCTLRQRLGAGLAGLALTYTIAKAMLFGLFTSKLPFIRTPKHEDQQAVVQALIMAQEETLLAFLLVLAGIAMWNFQGGEDPEARLWAVLMWAQSVPYWASFALSLISTAPKPPSKKTAATAQSLPSATPADQGSPAQ
ncbi:MAG TPA: glycosyltransferase [Ferrovibrio sp.]|jgi:exo-beta-1,3-glucanase (GH17 family)/cellulose synthase/poly-beta-1,6-N-acetylglucosamine synthase-like glycosyltransferase|uniref:glycosyltransferase n=1 Tax=Ferrovibrio sp. TaxID=1917215 RepID=UPI002B4B5EA1|nr:glycosyltransferase [Ferrovibrio sp.]HLT78645.1 glycosyltransferase [Ferrovibrio sp.]